MRDRIKGTQWEEHVFAVGGCVRDTIMGREVQDVDLAVSRRKGSAGFARWLAERNEIVGPVTAHPKFRVVMFRLREFPDVELQVIRTRAYFRPRKSEHRPAERFGTVESDARRRDFTINALFYNISSGKIIDVIGCSRADIKARVIRAVSKNPADIFIDDPVRILRCIRFACLYDWKIDRATRKAMHTWPEGLSYLKPGRIQQEYDKIPRTARARRLLEEAGVLPYIPQP